MLIRSEQLIKFVAILRSDVCIISGRHICAPPNGVPMQSEPYKFLSHILKNNSAEENCTDKRIGQAINLSIFYISDEILGFRHSTVLILVFDGVTVKTTNIFPRDRAP